MALQPVRELAMVLPFKIDSNGKIAATTDQSKIWQDRVRSVIGTAFGQRVYRPEFGCEAAGASFEPEQDVVNNIQQQIRKSFQKHLQLLSLKNVVVEIEQETRRILVSIEYSVPQGGRLLTQFGIAFIDGTNTIQEEVSWQIT